MPAFATHEIFGEEASWEYLSGNMRSCVQKHRGVFRTGTQGPDLFFYNLLLLRGETQFNLGSRMHEQCISSFFRNYLEEVSRCRSREKRGIAVAYFMGFLSHYTLDATMHPFVYSRIGYDPNDPASGVATLCAHHRLEAVMDQQMLWVKREQSPSEYVPSSRVQMTRHEINVISEIMAASLRRTYHVGVKPSNYKASYWCMCRITDFIYDRSGRKKPAIQMLEKNIIRKEYLSNLLVNNNLIDKDDAMNKEHQPWVNPWKKRKGASIQYTDAWKLYDMALEDYEKYAQIMAEVLTPLLEGGNVEDRIGQAVEKLEHRSYHKG